MAQEANEKDWLGYDDYAESLWHRIQREFEARPVSPDHRLPTGDPLVVGVYGEWGSGKTRLLELMHDKVHADALKTLGQRMSDPNAYDKELSITLPVWFHPWKYEHESALAVPLLMHISDALRVYLKEAQTTLESATDAASKASTQVAKVAEGVQKVVTFGQSLALGIHKATSHKAVKATVAVASGLLGAGESLRKGLDWIAEESGKQVGIDPDDEDSATSVEKKLKEEKKPKDKPNPPPPEPRLQSDGSFYYNIHKHLRALSVLTPEEAKKFELPTIKHPIRLNFVVFVDDLDRCLPEKAVQTLEVIKTLLNVECFAFVVALDDEVIERGIQHRYRDYRFEGVKPEMPITGFEYLEKIIHLPFRLPALTRPQAVHFIFNLENRLTLLSGSAELPRLWFHRLSRDDPAYENKLHVKDGWFAQPEAEAQSHGGEAGAGASMSSDPEVHRWQPTALVDMLLDCFDVPAPRKLARAVESLHHIQRVLHRRGQTLTLRREWPATAPERSPPDAALVLAFCLLQLFAPELFRLLRRRPLIWRQWIMAYLPDVRKAGPAFSYTGGVGQLDIEVSDEALHDWAAWGNEAADRRAAKPTDMLVQKTMISYSGDRAQWMSELANHAEIKGARRFYTEQVRLPWARALCEHRDVGRLSFDPLRLGAALVNTTGWKNDAQVVSDRDYHQLFGERAERLASVEVAQHHVITPHEISHSHTLGSPTVITGRSAVTLGNLIGSGTASVTSGDSSNKREVPINVFLELVLTDDSGARRSLVERLNLKKGEVLADSVWQALAAEMANSGGRLKLDDALMSALVLLAPYSTPAGLAVLGIRDWQNLGYWGSIGTADVTNAEFQERVRELGVIAQHKLISAYNLDAKASDAQQGIVNALDGKSVQPKERATLAALLAPFGDNLRFAFDPQRFFLPSRRHTSPEDLAANQHEPIPGFVLVPAGSFQRGVQEQSDNPPSTVQLTEPFYIARTLTTVQQWQAFLDGGGYDDDAWWDSQGIEWREGRFDSKVSNEDHKKWLARRPSDLRRKPFSWDEQIERPTCPVTGICWFEARAYARWLDAQLKGEIAYLQHGSQPRYAVRLPTEDQWERAARAASPQQADARAWPWSDDGQVAASAANVEFNIGTVSPVGSFPANPIGLYDMAGNVWEWQDNLYNGKPRANQHHQRIARHQELASAESREKSDTPALRGGSWINGADGARCASRFWNLPGYFYGNVGVRLVLSLADSES